MDRRILIGLILVSLCGFCSAYDCYEEYTSRCSSCSELVSCQEDLTEETQSCSIEENEICVQGLHQARCIRSESDCQCGERTGCFDDVYSKSHYLFCSSESAAAVYGACAANEVHDGMCGCMPATEEEIDIPFAPFAACSAECPYNITDLSANCYDYVNCQADQFVLSCPGTTAECFNVDTCACEAECDPLCPFDIADGPGDCEPYTICGGDGTPQLCLGTTCYDEVACNCLEPPTTTTSAAGTTNSCGAGCAYFAKPGNSADCDFFAACSAPDLAKECSDGGCFDETICDCAPGIVVTTTPVVVTTTPIVVVTTTPDTVVTTTPDTVVTTTPDTVVTTTPDGVVTTTPDSGTTIEAPCSNTEACNFEPGTGSDPNCSGYIQCGETVVQDCPMNRCYVQSECQCVATTTTECLSCGFRDDPNDACKGYINCTSSESLQCPLDRCFTPSTCLCE